MSVGVVLCGGTFGGVERSGVVHEVGVWDEAAVLTLVRSVGFEGEVEVRQPFAVLSENMTPSHWFALRDVTFELLELSEVEGVVVVVGTDTLAYTVAALDFLLRPPFAATPLSKPVVVTGALRPARSPGSDAANNLGCAISACRGVPAGVYASFGGGAFEGAEVLCATRVRKVGGSNAFHSFGVPSVATVDVFGGVTINESWSRHWDLNPSSHPFDAYFGDNPSAAEIQSLRVMESEWLAEPEPEDVSLVSLRSAPGVNYELYRDMVRGILDGGGCPIAHIESFTSGAVPGGTGGAHSVVGFAEWCKLHDVPVVATLPIPATTPDDFSLYTSSQSLTAAAVFVPTMLSEAATVKAILLGSFMGGSPIDHRLFRLLFSTPFGEEFICFE